MSWLTVKEYILFLPSWPCGRYFFIKLTSSVRIPIGTVFFLSLHGIVAVTSISTLHSVCIPIAQRVIFHTRNPEIFHSFTSNLIQRDIQWTKCEIIHRFECETIKWTDNCDSESNLIEFKNNLTVPMFHLSHLNQFQGRYYWLKYKLILTTSLRK